MHHHEFLDCPETLVHCPGPLGVVTALELAIAQQPAAGGHVDRCVAGTEPDDGANGNQGVHNHDRGRNARDRDEIGHQDQPLLQDTRRHPRGFLKDPACEHRAVAASMKYVLALHVFVEQTDEKRVADAKGEAVDCQETKEIHGVGDENDGRERRP